MADRMTPPRTGGAHHCPFCHMLWTGRYHACPPDAWQPVELDEDDPLQQLAAYGDEFDE